MNKDRSTTIISVQEAISVTDRVMNEINELVSAIVLLSGKISCYSLDDRPDPDKRWTGMSKDEKPDPDQ